MAPSPLTRSTLASKLFVPGSSSSTLTSWEPAPSARSVLHTPSSTFWVEGCLPACLPVTFPSPWYISALFYMYFGERASEPSQPALQRHTKYYNIMVVHVHSAHSHTHRMCVVPVVFLNLLKTASDWYETTLKKAHGIYIRECIRLIEQHSRGKHVFHFEKMVCDVWTCDQRAFLLVL